jgi:hypothetical protein
MINQAARLQDAQDLTTEENEGGQFSHAEN